MKLAKLSLAAVVAAGSFSLANAAVSLEEAIKDVEVSGMLRYRMYGKRETVKNDNGTSLKTTNGGKYEKTTESNVNKYRVDLNAKMKFDDYFTGNFGVRFLANDANDNGDSLDGQTVANDGSNIAIRDINLVYKNSDYGTTVKAGRQALDTLYTAGVLGNGIVVSNESIEGLKVSAFYVANMDKKDGSFSVNRKYTEADQGQPADYKDKKENGGLTTKDGKNINIADNAAYGIGVEGNLDVVDFGLWAVQSKDIATLYGLDLGAGIDMDDAKLAVKAQVSQTSLDGKMKSDADKGGLRNSTNYNLNVGFDMGIVNAKVGYASTGNKKGQSTTAIHDSGAFDYVGEILMDFNETDGQNQFIYASLGTKIDAFSAAFEYVNGKNKSEEREENIKGSEYTARLGYAYSEKLNFSGYYAMAETKEGSEKEETNKFRIEAKYKF